MLAGLNDEQRGWGRADETWRALDTVDALGGDAWFRLGDLDLGPHLVGTGAPRERAGVRAIGGMRSAATRGSASAPSPSACISCGGKRCVQASRSPSS